MKVGQFLIGFGLMLTGVAYTLVVTGGWPALDLGLLVWIVGLGVMFTSD